MRALAALVSALALALLSAAPSAAERSDGADKTVIFLAGSESQGPADCRESFGRMWKRLREMSFRGVEKAKWSEFAFMSVGMGADRNCTATLAGGDTVEGIAKVFAKWLHEHHSSKGRPVDVVAHGTGGIVLRYALAMSQRNDAGFPDLQVEDAVTIGTPHAGSAQIAQRCPGREICRAMAPGSSLLRTLAQDAFQRPSGKGGTDWTAIGSKGDGVVEADSAVAMNAQHKLVYLSENLVHDDLLADDSNERDADVEWSRGTGPKTLWKKAPHVVDRTGLALVFGGKGEDGGAGRAGCTGFNDEKDGPITADPRGVVSWPGFDDKLLSYVKDGLIEAYADCFHPVGTKTYASAGAVRLNGIDFVPAQGTTVVLDLAKRSISAESVTVSVPWRDHIPIPLVLAQRDFKWLLPRQPGAAVKNEEESVRLPLRKPGEVGHLPIGETLGMTMRQGSAALEVKLGLPPGLPVGAKLDAALSSTNEDGLAVDNIGGLFKGELTLKGMKLGAGLAFNYSWRQDEWRAEATVKVPWPPANPDVFAALTFQNGRLKALEGGVDDLAVPIGTTPLLLQRLSVKLVLRPEWNVEVGVGVGLGPKVFPPWGRRDYSVVDFQGSLGFTLKPSVKLDVVMNIIGQKWGNADLEADFSGSKYSLSARLGRRVEAWNYSGRVATHIEGTVKGAIDSKGLTAGATTKLCLDVEIRLLTRANACSDSELRITAFPKRVALSACGYYELGQSRYHLGIGIRSKQDGGFETDVAVASCDFGDWHAEPSTTRAHASAAREVTLAGGDGATLIGVVGRDGPPHIGLAGPRGRSVPAPARPEGIVRGGDYAIVHSPATRSTYVILAGSRRGRWRLETQPGSSKIERVLTADSLPEPRIRARVLRGRGGKRVLHYAVRAIPGQRVTFAEVGRRVNWSIGSARGRRGKLRFRPAFGPRGSRRIVARVMQDGLPRTELRVARYVAPRPPMPGAARRVTLSRRGSRLTATWSRVRHADGYRVTFRVPGGDSHTFDLAAGERRRVVLRGVDRGRARVRVRALRRDGRAGPVRSARTRPRR